MSNHQKLLQIRNKKLGLLILNARKSTRRSIEECAEAIGVSSEQFQEFEKGTGAPSLPHLELLALYLNIPVDHFWGRQVLPETAAPEPIHEKERLLALRNRVIGTTLRLSRNTANLSLKELAEKTGISEDQLKQYEMGEVPVPISELEMIANLIDLPLDRFYDQHGPIGKWRAEQSAYQKFVDLPPEIQEFICKPVNRPYLELAKRLSDLSAEKLRAVAEVLLEITY